MVVIGFWTVTGALLGALAAERKGFSTVAGVLGGLLLGPLAVLMFFVSSIAGERRRKCPRCAEWTKADAVICKHCRSEIGFDWSQP